MRNIVSLIFLFVLIVSCSNNDDEWKNENGNPADILGDSYDKLIEKYMFVGNFQEGTIIVEKDGKFGLLNFDGDNVLPCEYDSITELKESSRIIRKEGKYGIVNYDASFIAECIHDSCLVPSPQYAPVKLNNKWGIINRKGEKIIQYKYEDVSQYDDSIFVAQYNGKYGIVDYTGRTLIDFKCDWIEARDYNTATYLVIDGKVAIANHEYKQVTEPIFSASMFERYDHDGYASLKLLGNGKYGLVHVESGKTIVPFEYDNIGWYSEGLVRVCKNDKWGYMDNKGNLAIPLKFNDAEDFSEGYALVGTFYANKVCAGGLMTENHYGFINKKGEVVIPFKFADQHWLLIDGFHCGLAAMGDYQPNNIYAGKLGYIDKTGTFVIKPQYDSADSFFMGLAVVGIDDREGVINSKGEIIIPLNYESIWINHRDSIITFDNKTYKIIGEGKVSQVQGFEAAP